MSSSNLENPSDAQKAGFQFPFAFCLLTYMGKKPVGTFKLVIYNTRDGEAPLEFTSHGVKHILVESRFAPDHIPHLHDGIFVDLSEEKASENAMNVVNEFWDREPMPLSNLYPNKKSAAMALAKDYQRNCYLEIVTKEWLENFTEAKK